MTTDSAESVLAQRIDAALALAFVYGPTDGAHHKMWVIDQMVRALTGDEYDGRVRDLAAFGWDEGIAP